MMIIFIPTLDNPEEYKVSIASDFATPPPIVQGSHEIAKANDALTDHSDRGHRRRCDWLCRK
jgi:hypothetical protein